MRTFLNASACLPMNAFILTFGLSIASISLLSAQSSNTTTIEAGDDVQHVLKDQVYRFPSFQRGTVFFRNGKSSVAKLNLNLLLDEMQFIDPKKDTLAIADPASIERIEIDGANFLYSDGYLELIGVYGNGVGQVGLAVKRKLKIVDRQKEGAYGQKTSTSSISSMNTHLSGNDIQYDLTVKENLVVGKEETFYLLDEKQNLRLLNKLNMLKAFPEHKQAISHYLKQHKVDYKNEAELRALLIFSSEL